MHQFGTVAAFLIAAGTLLQLVLSESSSWIRFRAARSDQDNPSGIGPLPMKESKRLQYTAHRLLIQVKAFT